MTTKEKLLYDKAEIKWEKTKLRPVRDAVSQRLAKPDENFPPFADIADIIISVNDINMVVSSGNSEDTVKKYELAKFNSIDEEWYKNVILKASSSSVIKSLVKEAQKKAKIAVAEKKARKAAEAVAEKTEAIEEQKMAEQKVERLKEESIYTTSIIAPIIIESSPELNLADLIPSDQYNDLQYEIAGCEGAEEYLNKLIVVYKRPITYADKNELTKLSLLCKTAELGEWLSDQSS